MGAGGRVADQCLRAAEGGGLTGDRGGLHEPLSGVDPPGQVEGQQPTHGSHLADGQVVLGMGGQPRIAHLGDGPVALEEAGQALSRLGLGPQPDV